MWCPAPPGVEAELVAAEPERFFKPSTSATGVFSGSVGTFLDPSGGNRVDWAEVAVIIEDAYRMVAPKKLIAELDGGH